MASKPNTRQIDRRIRDIQEKQLAVSRREAGPLTSSEKRRLISNLAVASVKVARHKSPAKANRRAMRVWDDAAQRLACELEEAVAERAKVILEHEKAKAGKRESRWW